MNNMALRITTLGDLQNCHELAMSTWAENAIPGSLLQIILPNSLNDDRGYHEPPSDHAGKRLV